MKEENERRIVAEKQVDEIGDKIAVQVEYICCKWYDWFSTSKYQTSSWRKKHPEK